MSFNSSQTEAIGHKEGPMLVLAGPGSGKTLVITERTRNLILNEHISPSEILVITFTKAPSPGISAIAAAAEVDTLGRAMNSASAAASHLPQWR